MYYNRKFCFGGDGEAGRFLFAMTIRIQRCFINCALNSGGSQISALIQFRGDFVASFFIYGKRSGAYVVKLSPTMDFHLLALELFPSDSARGGFCEE